MTCVGDHGGRVVCVNGSRRELPVNRVSKKARGDIG